MQSLLDYALSYARAGFRVFPAAAIKSHIVTQWEPTGDGDEKTMTGTSQALGCTCPAGVKCDAPGKHPVFKGWQEKATRDESQLVEWFDPKRGKFAAYNLAIATGVDSGVFVLDVDPKDGGPGVLDALEANHGALPDTLTQQTGSGGRHHLFRWPNFSVSNAVSLFQGLDIRGEGGLIIVEPSRHVSGSSYSWLDGDPSTVKPVDAPEWLLDFVRKASGKHDAGKASPRLAIPEDIDSGSRNATLFRLGAGLRHYGFGAVELEAALRTANSRCKPPLSDEEVLQIVESVQRYRRGSTTDGAKIANYEVDFEVDGQGKRKPKFYRLEANKILSTLFEVTGDWPKRLGSELFVDDGTIGFLKDSDALFGFLYQKAAIQWREGSDAEGARFLGRRELVSILSRSAPAVAEFSSTPLYPLPADTYVCQGGYKPAGGDGSALWGLLRFFSPASDVDEALLLALLLTPFWGGKPGSRPLLVLTGEEGVGLQAIGKTSAVQKLTAPAGGVFSIDLEGQYSRDPIQKQLLSDEALHRRVVLLDNLEGVTHSRELASLITLPAIDGRPSHGKQRRRMNYLTWTATAVTPSLVTDLTSRAFAIYLNKPSGGDSWETSVDEYIEKNRDAIIGDAIACLAGPKNKVDVSAGRFPTWVREVLAVSPFVNDVLSSRAGRLDTINDDQEAISLFLQALKNDSVRNGKTEYSASDLSEIWKASTGRELAAAWVGRRLREYRAKGLIVGALRPKWTGKHGSPWIVTPSGINIGESEDQETGGSGNQMLPDWEGF